ncbi:MAG: AMP-binding protein [Burkholderiales bacterium]
MNADMRAKASAQTDRFVHERLPAPDQWPQMRYDLPELQIPDQANLVDVLLAQIDARDLWHRPFLRSQTECLNYAEVSRRINRIALVLTQDLGLVPGNRVLLRGGNSIAMALAWLGVVKAGLVAVASMPLLRAKELGEILGKAQIEVALCDAALLGELQQVQAQQPCLKTIVPFGLFNAQDVLPDLPTKPLADSLEQRAALKKGRHPPCPTAADDMALIAFTSGTTGQPKAAVHTHRDVLAACNAWPRHVLQANEHDVVMGSPPLAFTFGLGGLLLFPMSVGACVYFPDTKYTPEAMAAHLFESRATICYTAPTFYRQMEPFMRQHVQTGRQIALRICVSAGEALPDATRQLWKQATGIELLDGIGATELFHIFISSKPGDVRRGAIGQVVPGYSAKVVDENGQEMPRGSVGSLAVIGPTGCKYLDDARQSNYVKNGWNHPGDAVAQDADGYFFYQSRADDMIITAGYNVGGPEVEDALLQHPAVAECAVVGVPDTERGMLVKAFCVLRPGHAGTPQTAQALQDHVKATLAPYKYPRQVEFVAALPRTETGKLQRFKLRTT